jgi:hypothetical protein
VGSDDRSDLIKNITKRKTLFVLLCLSLSLVLLLFVEYAWDEICRTQIGRTQASLLIVRQCIKEYKETNGRYPKNIEELRQYLKNDPNFKPLDSLYVDFKSTKQSNFQTYSEINGKGGYYYDANSGDIRVNLTEPVGHYFFFYGGSLKDEIPVKW